MAKDDERSQNRRSPEEEIADAAALFHDDPRARKPNQGATRAHATGAGAGEVFDLAEDSQAVDAPPVRPAAPIPSVPPKRQVRETRDGAGAKVPVQAPVDPADLVGEVWSRRAEWGITLAVLAAWGTFILLFVYFVLGTDYLWLSLLTLILGGMVGAFLSYPILITLERPVRITPEQAVRDFYGSLSHHFPHFRRMWLLLSSAGRISTAYGSFEGFKSYWKKQLARMRKGKASAFTPLAFEIVDFKSPKSAGEVRIDAEFTLKIWVRGQRRAGTIQVVPLKISLVRGPDKMWYLEDGTQPRPE